MTDPHPTAKVARDLTEIWAVAHPQHPTTYRDTKAQALALVDAWTTERNAAICWPMTVEEA